MEFTIPWSSHQAWLHIMHSDAGIYHCQDTGGQLIIILYVNDITILRDSHNIVDQIKITLSSCYEMTDLRQINSYLGVQITQNRSIKHLEIDQSYYILEIIKHFRLADTNLAHTLLPTGTETHLIKHNGEASPTEIKHY
jgi:Reverse transcriptase (RNA-dependent DNA polymerase)